MKLKRGFCLIILNIFLICFLSGCESIGTYWEYFIKVYQTDSDSYDNSESNQSDSGKANENQISQKSLKSTNSDYSHDTDFLCDWTFKYYYTLLNDQEKIWYRDIEKILGNMESDVMLSEEVLGIFSDEELSKIFQYVCNDHPELFYVDGFSYVEYTIDSSCTDIEFSGQYSLSKSEALTCLEKIKTNSQNILNNISDDMDDYAKLKYIYDYIVLNTDYDINAAHNQDLYSVIVLGDSVCQGYSKAFQYLALMENIEATIVTGSVYDGQSHAWNLVNSDGSFYYVDVTWGDRTFSDNLDEDSTDSEEINGDLKEEEFNVVSYDFFCVNYEEIKKTHSFENSEILPRCISTQDNYYVREGLIFSSYDFDELKEIFASRIEQGTKFITIKCFNHTIYSEMEEKLINDSEIMRVIPKDYDEVSYSLDEDKLTLLFWVTN